MSSSSVSSLILFIAAMLVAAGVAGTLVASVNDISGSIDTRGGDVSDQIDTDVEIISDAGSEAVYTNGDGEVDGNLTVLVKNTGSATLSSDGNGFDVLVDGHYVPREDVRVAVRGDDTWRGGVVAELEIEDGLDFESDAGSEHRLVVDVGGDREEFEFYVPAQP